MPHYHILHGGFAAVAGDARTGLASRVLPSGAEDIDIGIESYMSSSAMSQMVAGLLQDEPSMAMLSPRPWREEILRTPGSLLQRCHTLCASCSSGARPWIQEPLDCCHYFVDVFRFNSAAELRTLRECR